ncbi:aminotransferase class V-fold PLP-dependent enzyme [Brevundimonas variabilis]|nr:aminotransferase class V-fold PLP-dependent enzyme [Brevundimonas variabilis]
MLPAARSVWQQAKFVFEETNIPLYFDSAATTRPDPRVMTLVMRLMTEEYGNAGSRTHVFGAQALKAVNRARDQVAKVVGATPDEIVFTSGATESDNLAILGLADHGAATGRRHVVSSAIEHKAVLEPLEHLRKQGFEITLVKPDSSGHVSASDVLGAVRPDTFLVSLMHGNNETGALQPITQVADGLTDEGPYFHVDAAQTFGREIEALRHPRTDLISISGHKVYAPKGVGALVIRRRGGRRVPLAPLMFGGGQERGLRPGTQPVALIAGLGLASELALREADTRRASCISIRAQAMNALASLNPVVLGGGEGEVLPHILSLAVPGVDSEAIMVAAKDLLALSNGSACTSSSYEPSHVLTAMGLGEDQVAGTVRLSWSHDTAIAPWTELARRLRDLRE